MSWNLKNRYGGFGNNLNNNGFKAVTSSRNGGRMSIGTVAVED